jgi:hypothetical protein
MASPPQFKIWSVVVNHSGPKLCWGNVIGHLHLSDLTGAGLERFGHEQKMITPKVTWGSSSSYAG